MFLVPIYKYKSDRDVNNFLISHFFPIASYAVLAKETECFSHETEIHYRIEVDCRTSERQYITIHNFILTLNGECIF
jgi:hypothetical protein